jgi:hypothetical protein
MRRRWVTLLVALLTLISACGQASPPGAVAPAPVTGESGDEKEPALPERMIVRNGRIELTVLEMPSSVEAVTALAGQLGGFVLNSDVREQDGQPFATLSLRVPSTRYDEAMRELRRLAVKIDSENSNAQDVTEEFADLGLQVRNLEATEAQYLELLKRAQSVEDVLRVQQRLGEVRTQIERLRGRMNALQRRTDFSQIEVTLRANTFGFRPFRYARDSWEMSLRALEGAIGVAVAGWWLWLLIAVFVLWARRRRGPPSRPDQPVEGGTSPAAN